MSFGGSANDGEVEDYTVEIVAKTPLTLGAFPLPGGEVDVPHSGALEVRGIPSYTTDVIKGSLPPDWALTQ